jgi:YHS domain-containing protein
MHADPASQLSGTPTMFRNSLTQRALLVAAVSSAASISQQSTAAPADTPARTASANPSAKASGSTAKSPAPASYAPGSVNGELQRLFNESGQEMPSMRQQDLPNAKNMQSHLVRPKTQAPPKKNVFQKMWGKITGSDSKNNATAAAPPVPPATKLPATPQPVPPAGHSFSDNTTQNPRTIDRLLGRNSTNPQNSPQSRSAPPVPPTPKSTTAQTSPLPATILRKPQSTQSPLVQPGAAPAFMGASASRAAAATAKAIPNAPPIPIPPEDPLESLDLNSPDNDVLDLDAVAKSAEAAAAATSAAATSAASAAVTSAASAAKSAAAAATTQLAEDLDAKLPKPVDSASEFSFLEQPQPSPDTEQPTPPTNPADNPASNDNPFTGIGLESPQQFDPTLPDVSKPNENTVTPPSEPLQSVDTERMRLAAELAERQQQLQRILSRGDMTGFKGFCPVALRDQRQLVDAQPQIQSTFGLHTWTFSSDEARLAFEANPTRYAPVAGGADPVLLTNSQQEVPGKLDYALWFRGRLHLFSSRDTMATFLENPQQFAVAEPE